MLAVVAADEHQDAGEQRQDRQHEQAGRGLAGGFLDPADQIGAAEAGEVADRVDQGDPPAAAVPESQAVGRVQNTPKQQNTPIAATVSTTIVMVGSVR